MKHEHPATEIDKFSGSQCKCLEDRPLLERLLTQKEEQNKMTDFRIKFNCRSLDGLPGLRTARKSNGEWLWVADSSSWMKKKFGYPEALLLGILIGILLHMAAPTLHTSLIFATEELKGLFSATSDC